MSDFNLPEFMTCQLDDPQVNNETPPSVVIWVNHQSGRVVTASSEYGPEKDDNKKYTEQNVSVSSDGTGAGTLINVHEDDHKSVVNGAVVSFVSNNQRWTQIYYRDQNGYLEELRQSNSGNVQNSPVFRTIPLEATGKTLAGSFQFKVLANSPISAHVTYDNKHVAKQIKVYYYHGEGGVDPKAKDAHGLTVAWCDIGAGAKESVWRKKVIYGSPFPKPKPGQKTSA